MATFRQQSTTALASNVAGDLLVEGSAGTLTNSAPAVFLGVENLGNNALTTVTVFVDIAGYGTWIPDPAAGAALSGVAPNASAQYTLSSRPWAVRVQGLAVLATSVRTTAKGTAPA